MQQSCGGVSFSFSKNDASSELRHIAYLSALVIVQLVSLLSLLATRLDPPQSNLPI